MPKAAAVIADGHTHPLSVTDSRMRDATDCANCTRAIDGDAQKFCPACGQPTPARRIDWAFMRDQFRHDVLEMESGLLHTLRRLMFEPGCLLRDYVEGRRAGIVKPFVLLMMTAALLLILAKYLLAGDLVGAAITINPGSEQPGVAGGMDVDYLLRTITAVKDWINQHYTVLTLLLLPLEALAFKLAFRRTGALDYPEWLVIATFLIAQSFVVQALAMPLQRAYPDAQGPIMLVAIVYGVVSLVQYFGRDHARWKIALRAVLGYALFTLATFALTVAGALWIVLSAMRG
ncbi:hypothetical protein MASR1M8_24340 [Thermomonas brevis]